MRGVASVFLGPYLVCLWIVLPDLLRREIDTVGVKHLEPLLCHFDVPVYQRRIELLDLVQKRLALEHIVLRAEQMCS